MVVEGERKVQSLQRPLRKEILAHGTGVQGSAAGDALALLCNLGAHPELPSGAGWKSVDEHGPLLEQGEIAGGRAGRTCKENPT